MNTYTNISISAFVLAIALFIGGLPHGVSAAPQETPKIASTDELLFVQTTLRITDKKLAKIEANAPIESDTTVNESLDNISSRTTYYRVGKGDKLDAIGEIVGVDIGKTGHLSHITVRNKQYKEVVSYLRNSASDWVVTSYWGRDDRTLKVPSSIAFDTNDVRANTVLVVALDAIEHADKMGRDAHNFIVTSYTNKDTFTVSPLGAFGHVIVWKTYSIVGGVLQ